MEDYLFRNQRNCDNSYSSEGMKRAVDVLNEAKRAGFKATIRSPTTSKSFTKRVPQKRWGRLRFYSFVAGSEDEPADLVCERKL